VDAPVDRTTLLRELGYGHPEALAQALAVLYAAGLTNPRKTGIAPDKRPRIREALARALVRVCARCAGDLSADGRTPVPALAAIDCERCGGSANRAALTRAADACRGAGLHRIAVVGGAPGIHVVLRELWPADLELRIISGTERHSRADAVAVLAWADVVLVWAPTALAHRVSDLYTRAGRAKVVAVHRRGIEALADALALRARDR
jgi:hypothetical protein